MLVEGGRRMPNLAFPRHDTSENTYNLLNNMANGGSHANRRPDHVVQRSAYTTKRYCDAQRQQRGPTIQYEDNVMQVMQGSAYTT